MLPRIFPPFPERKEFELFASMDPAREVGGDFYDFLAVTEPMPLVALGGLLRLGFATALLILASQYGIMPCLLSFAGLWLARWIIILFTLPHHQVSKELNG